MKFKTSAPLAVLFSIFLAGSAMADQWLHVKVEGSGDERVTVNLPLSLMEAAVAMIPEEVTTDLEGEIQVAIDDVDMDWQDLRNFWQSVKDTPEATFATVETQNETVEVKKEGAYLKIRTTELRGNGADVDVQLPLAVVDALFSGPDGTINFAAAVRALAEEGDGHLVQIKDGDETVRVWIDDNDTAD